MTNKQPNEVHIDRSQLDENGLVYCWSVTQDKWIKRTPIDAREGVAYGDLSFTKPGESVEPTQPTKDDLEARLASKTKSQLRDLCIKHEVPHTGMDTKTSLITRLMNQGVQPD